jgi:alkanesulfonate monooxygenase SsuD/methylene tetrahydromethanopterin reductase-like flavin-dependent oxidoreductase (luciferase family)
MMVPSAVEEEAVAGRRVDVGLLVFTGEGLRPTHVESEFSVVDVGILGEQVGFDSIGVIDHLRWNIATGPHGFWECTTVVAALAATTSRVRLFTAVLASPFRNPALVAKIAETIDMISDGRFVLGLGASSGPLEEYESFGFPQDHLYSRFAEAIEIISSLLREGECDFEGTFSQARDCVLRPRGPRPSGPPIAIGASGPRMMRLAARFADEWNGLTFGTPTVEHFAPMVEEVDAACREVGRDPATLRRSVDIIVAPTAVTDIGIPGFGTPINGTPAEIATQLAAFSDIGIAEVHAYLWPQSRAAVEAMTPVLEALDAA